MLNICTSRQVSRCEYNAVWRLHCIPVCYVLGYTMSDRLLVCIPGTIFLLLLILLLILL